MKPASEFRQVFINGTRVGDETISAIEPQFGGTMRDGRYWYDPMCGAWGLEGGPASGFTVAGVDMWGPLRADASNGNTGISINGREIHYLDLVGLQQVAGGYAPTARYWLDAYGNYGYEGGPAMGNLMVIAYNSGGGSSGSGGGSVLTTWDRTGVAVY